jgi:hypothetical protein
MPTATAAATTNNTLLAPIHRILTRRHQIRQSPGDFQNPVMGAGGEVHFLHRVLKVSVSFGS